MCDLTYFFWKHFAPKRTLNGLKRKSFKFYEKLIYENFLIFYIKLQ